MTKKVKSEENFRIACGVRAERFALRWVLKLRQDPRQEPLHASFAVFLVRNHGKLIVKWG
jgi:hypothetical protein